MSRYIVQNIKLPIEASKDEVLSAAKQRLLKFFSKANLISCDLHKQSVDARKKNDICFVYSVMAEIRETNKIDKTCLIREGIVLWSEETPTPVFGVESMKGGRPIIVGFGPCGMFCALMLAKNGYKPLVIERGPDVARRTAAVDHFMKTGTLNPEANIQFGAGGAGTFSDGKLVTRIHDPHCSFVISEMHRLGGPDDILTRAKPHVGTDYLKRIVANMADEIVALGGEILFDTKLEQIRFEHDRAVGIQTNKGDFSCGALILALGHSARDTFSMLKTHHIAMIPKPFSVGVRIEHLQSSIDSALYGNFAGHPLLPPGEYNLSCHIGGRGVYTFCMCPGGEVVAAASEEGGVVTNGMSRFRRDGVNANSAVAVSVLPSDFGASVEEAIAFQRNLEAAAYAAGGKNYMAPCQTVGHFLGNSRFNEPSVIHPTYRGGLVTMTDLHEVLPEFISSSLREGLLDFNRKIHGFAKNEALLTGVETRTSSPIRILRNELFLADGFDNIYPCGEGAGYAGGITSAAVDGIRCALAIMARYRALQ